jgi:hypothetical protein
MNYNSCWEGRDCHVEHPAPRGVLMNCGCGGYVDLSNMPTGGVVLARTALDTTLLKNPIVKIDFNCMLSYTLVMLEELNLIFTLVRKSENGDTAELASWPYKILMDQNLTGTEGEEYVYVVLEKNETVSLAYCDQPGCGDCSTYMVRLDVNYFNITNAVISSAFISTIAQSTPQQ